MFPQFFWENARKISNEVITAFFQIICSLSSTTQVVVSAILPELGTISL
jgi:hypothetical protein